MPGTLPNFDTPPLTETVLGLQFAPLRWTVAHFGLFWSEIRSEFPKHEIQPPLDAVVEQFGEHRNTPAMFIEFSHQPRLRSWFLEPSDSRLIQVQADRFIHNWRKVGDADKYPRYERIRPMFEMEWGRFRSFVRREELGEPRISQCEVTYVNQIERGEAWNTLDDLNKVFTFCAPRSTSYLQTPEAVLSKLTFLVPDMEARLHVDLALAIRNADLREVLQFTLTARGQPASGSLEDIRAWMDSARQAVVDSFVDLTTPRMHTLWGRKA